MWNLNLWWHIAQFVIFMCPVSVITYLVFINKLSVGKAWYWIIMSVYTAMVSIIIALTMTEISPYRFYSVSGLSVIIVISILTLKIIIRKSTYQILFVFFVFLNAQFNTILVAHAVLSSFQEISFFPYEYGDKLFFSIFCWLMLLPAVYHLLVKFYKRIVESSISIKKMDFFFLLPAGFFIVVLTFVTSTPNFRQQLPGAFLCPLIFINICAFASYFSSLAAIISSHSAALEHEQLFAANNQLVLWQLQYEHLRSTVSLEAKTRHDWKHHIVAVLGYANQNDINGLKKYLADYQERYFTEDNSRICNIASLYILLQYYVRKAAQLHIEIFASTFVLEGHKADVLDLTVVFGNLLENAMEACERMKEGKKFVKLRVQGEESGLLIIICENSFDGVLNEKGNKIMSRKEKGGIGLLSIESIAKKYNGDMRIESEEKKFRVKVILQS